MGEKWSEIEVCVLIEKFPISTKTEIEDMFPNRTYYSIYKKANNMLFATQGEHTAFHNRQRKHASETKEKISRKAKERYSDPKNHPCHRELNIIQMMKEIDGGMTVGEVCEKYGIVKSTYYRRIKKGDF